MYEQYYPNTLSNSKWGGFLIQGLYYPNILNLLPQDLIAIWQITLNFNKRGLFEIDSSENHYEIN